MRPLVAILALVVVVVLQSVVVSVKAQSPVEAEVLDDLRTAWNLTRIGWKGNASDACSLKWQGLTCSGGHVVELYDLFFLPSLDFSFSVSGKFECTKGVNLIWNCRDLSDNQLSGTIPSSLGNLSNLQSLYVVLNRESV